MASGGVIGYGVGVTAFGNILNSRVTYANH